MYATLAMLVAVIAPLPTLMRSMAQKVTPFRAVVNGVVAGAIGALIVMVLAQMTGTNAFDQLREAAQLTVDTLTASPEMVQMMGGNLSADEVSDRMMLMYEAAIQSLPATICIMAALASYVEYIILSKIYKPAGIAPIPMTPMREYNLPHNIVKVWLLLFLVSLLLTGTEGFAFDFVLSNITSLFNVLFMVQGISVIFMFAYGKRWPKAVAVIAVIILLMINMGNLLLTLLGFTDVLFGLKRRIKNKMAV